MAYSGSFNLKILGKIKETFLTQILDYERCKKDGRHHQLKKIEILLIRSQTHINKNLLKTFPSLQFIITATSGFDHIDLEACASQGISVSHLPKLYPNPVSELVLAFILSLYRKLPQANQIMEKKSWKNRLSRGETLYGKKLGLIGLGHIGSAVAIRAQAFGMHVSAYDPYLSKRKLREKKVEFKTFESLLTSSDIVSLHVPLTEKTKYLINRKSLRHFHSKGFLINTSRGKVVCEKDLLEALKKKTLQGAALDVFEQEPLSPTSPLRKAEGVLLTPHIGSFTEEIVDESSHQILKMIIQYKKEKKVINALPHSLTWWKKDKNKKNESALKTW